jgi:hypothetical protein
MIYVRHYFPGVNLETVSDEDFAMLSEEALWLHEQMTVTKMTANAVKQTWGLALAHYPCGRISVGILLISR